MKTLLKWTSNFISAITFLGVSPVSRSPMDFAIPPRMTRAQFSRATSCSRFAGNTAPAAAALIVALFVALIVLGAFIRLCLRTLIAPRILGRFAASGDRRVRQGIRNGSPTASQYGSATASTTTNAISVIHTPKRKISGALR